MFGGTGIIGQTLGLARSNTVAPQNVPNAPVNSQNSNTAATFGVAVSNQINSIGFQFKPCLPLNQTVAQKAINKQTEVSSYLNCITGVDQFQTNCIFELALNDRRLMRQGGVSHPTGNLSQLGIGFGQNAQQNLGGGVFGQNAQPQAIGGGGLFGGQQPLAAANGTAGNGLFGGQTQAATGGLFGGATQQQQPQTTPFGGGLGGTGGGGLFGANNTATQAPNGGGLFGGQPAATTGGLFGGNQPAANTGGGLFGATQPAAATGNGLFGGATNQNTGMFGGINNQNKGGLFGGNTGGGLLGQQQPANNGGGLFGQTQNQMGGGLFQQQQQQQQNQNQQLFSCQNEMIEEIRRIEEAKAFSQNKIKEEQGIKNLKYAERNHINHINYLKSQQQKRNVLQQYTIQNKNPTKFIEAPYTVKVNVSWDNIKRNEWQLLERSQNIKQTTYLNMGGDQRLYPSHNQVLYNQLRQLERTSNQLSSKSIAAKELDYQKEQFETFSQTSYFKKMQPLVSQKVENDKLQSESTQDIDDGITQSLKEKSIQYLYEQSLKKISLKIFEDQDYITIPIQVKSTYTISYLLTLVFDYIEEHYNINPEKLNIYFHNYVLYQPLDIEHLIQVRKDSLISEIETSQQGRIGTFEIVQLDSSDIGEIEIPEEQMDEEEDEEFFLKNEKYNFLSLPIIPEGYYTEPNLKELITKSTEQLRKFKNFKIGNEHAEVCFEGEIDLCGRDFSRDLLIKENEVILYPYQRDDEPPVQYGYGLNVQATIKRFNASKVLLSNEKFDIQKIERKIKKLAHDYKMQIVEPYNPKTDSFTVRVFKF